MAGQLLGSVGKLSGSAASSPSGALASSAAVVLEAAGSLPDVSDPLSEAIMTEVGADMKPLESK